jgi:hypothetical protein
MRPNEVALAKRLHNALKSYSSAVRPLPGISTDAARNSLVEQMIESMRRVRYVAIVAGREIAQARADPANPAFDPLKASILHLRRGDMEEAFWLIFLFVHFGRSARTGWRLARDIYGRLGQGQIWDWGNVSHNPEAFREWLAQNEVQLRGGDGVPRQFGNPGWPPQTPPPVAGSNSPT